MRIFSDRGKLVSAKAISGRYYTEKNGGDIATKPTEVT